MIVVLNDPKVGDIDPVSFIWTVIFWDHRLNLSRKLEVSHPLQELEGRHFLNITLREIEKR
jgi:hypothetical protein